MDFAGIIDTWRNVLLRPGEEVFEEEKTRPSANLSTGLIWIVIGAVIAGLLGWLQALIFRGSLSNMDGLFSTMDLPPEAAEQFEEMFATVFGAGLMGAGTLAGIVLTPLFFLIGVGIVHLLAKLLGGQGEYGTQAYLFATFQAPIAILSAIIGFVPFLGGCISFLLSIYGWVLSYFAVKVNYGLTSGKALAVILIPLVVVLLLFACAVFAGISLAVLGTS